MAPTTSSSFSGEDFTSTFQHSSINKLNNQKAEERSQASAGAREDKSKQNQPQNTPDKTLDDETYFAESEDSDYVEYERLRMKRKHKKAGGAGKEHDTNQTKFPPIRCEKCNIAFETVEERTTHIKTSSTHFCCQKCEGIVEFHTSSALFLHHINQHPAFYCYICDHHSATAEEHKIHVKTSPRHF